MKKYLLPIILASTFLIQSIAQQPDASITQQMKSKLQESGLPGFAVAVVENAEITYLESFGYQDISNKVPFSVDQRFNIASISKTFIGLSLMTLVQEGTINLTDDINKYLPFSITNPFFPEAVIQIAHLANHTSSLQDFNIEESSWYLPESTDLDKKNMPKKAYKVFCEYQKNKAHTLEEMLSKTLASSDKKFFLKKLPGSFYQYSNLGASLAALIVEKVSGIPYDQYVESWLAKMLDINGEVWKQHTPNLPIAYFQNGQTVPAYLPSLFPTGGMMLSIRELAQYLTAIITNEAQDQAILAPKAYGKLFETSDDFEHGVFWAINGSRAGHNGGNYGVTTFLQFDRKTGQGKIFLTNISSYQDQSLLESMVEIWKSLPPG